MRRISWINAGLGLWLVVVAMTAPQVSGDQVVEDIVTGLFIMLAAVWATQAFSPPVSAAASWMVVLTGGWAAVAPFILG